jgi:hypothetical protein
MAIGNGDVVALVLVYHIQRYPQWRLRFCFCFGFRMQDARFIKFQIEKARQGGPRHGAIC